MERVFEEFEAPVSVYGTLSVSSEDPFANMQLAEEITTSREDLCCTWCLPCVEGADHYGCGG